MSADNATGRRFHWHAGGPRQSATGCIGCRCNRLWTYRQERRRARTERCRRPADPAPFSTAICLSAANTPETVRGAGRCKIVCMARSRSGSRGQEGWQADAQQSKWHTGDVTAEDGGATDCGPSVDHLGSHAARRKMTGTWSQKLTRQSSALQPLRGREKSSRAAKGNFGSLRQMQTQMTLQKKIVCCCENGSARPYCCWKAMQ